MKLFRYLQEKTLNLLELITWCEVTNLVTEHVPANVPHDHEADAHYKLKIDNGKYFARVIYAVLHEQAVIVSANLYKRGGSRMPDVFPQPGVGDLVRAFCE